MVTSALCQPRQAARTGFFGTSCPRLVRGVTPIRAPTTICASYKNGENVDLSHMPQYMRHETDTGSTESQVARLTARVQQISSHLKINRKDFSAKRGLELVLSQRKSLLQYLYRDNRDAYDKLVRDLSLKSVVTSDTRGATRENTEQVPV